MPGRARSPGRVSPGLTAGGGLKLLAAARAAHRRRVSPGLTAGGGLKLSRRPLAGDRLTVSPGLTAGGGLKLRPVVDRPRERPRFPRPHRRGRIETGYDVLLAAMSVTEFPPASPPGAD